MKKFLAAFVLLLWLTLTARAEKPNVIIIYSDDHGYTDLGIPVIIGVDNDDIRLLGTRRQRQ